MSRISGYDVSSNLQPYRGETSGQFRQSLLESPKRPRATFSFRLLKGTPCESILSDVHPLISFAKILHGYKDGPNLLGMLTAYLDESESQDGYVFCVAGYVAPAEE